VNCSQPSTRHRSRPDAFTIPANRGSTRNDSGKAGQTSSYRLPITPWSARRRRAPPPTNHVGGSGLNDPAVVAGTGILFMEGASEPAELIAIQVRWEAAAGRYRAMSDWLAERMTAGWSQLTRLLTPLLIESAYPRLMALARTTTAGSSYDPVAHLLNSAAQALRNQDLTPAGVRFDPEAATSMIRTAAWLADAAAATIAETVASLSLSDPDWTEFINHAESRLSRPPRSGANDM
jgi:hypothetical protein